MVTETILLVHGFPHTSAVWNEVIGPLSRRYRVLAPDLPWFEGGASDAATLSRWLEGLLDGPAVVVAIDAGVPAAFLLATRRPDLVSRLVLVEGTLPAPDAFPAGPPWWFGFHAVPGLAERVLAGHEAEYVGWFYDQGTRGRGVHPEIRAAFGEAYARPGALSGALGFYRTLGRSAEQVAGLRLKVPTTAVGAAPVGRRLAEQLRPITDDLAAHLVEDCGHIVPLDRPEALLRLL
jgi:pimeloyl-ACP methyl ester carboxylesterase